MRNYYDPIVLSFFVPFHRTFSFLNIFLSEKEFHPFPSSLSSSSLTYVTPSPDSHNSLLKSMDSLSWSLFYIYVCLCVCKYANTSCSVCFGCVCGFRTGQPALDDGERLINLLSAVISFPQIVTLYSLKCPLVFLCAGLVYTDVSGRDCFTAHFLYTGS